MALPIDFQVLFNASGAAHIALSPELKIIAASDAYLQLARARREEVIGCPLFGTRPAFLTEQGLDRTEELRASLEKAMRDRATDTIAIRTRSGYLKLTSKPITDDESQVRYLLLDAVDAGQATRNEFSAQANDTFFEVALDMLCISGYDGYFKKVNPAFEATLGFTAQELCSKSYLEFIHPDDLERTRREVEMQLAKGEKVLSFENRYLCKDGNYKLLSWKSAPVGNLMYAAARDVTEARQTYSELKKAKEESDWLNRELKSFSYSIAHDLRAPLQNMRGYSSLLLEDLGATLTEDVRGPVIRIASAANKMDKMIGALLNLSGITHKQITKQPVDMSALAHEVVQELQTTSPDRRAHFTIADGLVDVGDPVLLRVVMTNLLSNAWKYSSKLLTNAEIEFDRCESHGKLAYFVRDNGAGFDMTMAENLFGAFQRLHSAEEFEGNGIGLATVQRIIHRHGGSIWVDSSPGKGATFYFALS